MPDESTATGGTATTTSSTASTDASTGTGTTHATGGGGGGGLGGHGRTPAKLPTLLQPGDRDPDPMSLDENGMHPPRWISYLQQMLNYWYQSEVCNDNGEFDELTARAVRHFREQNELGSADYVDVYFWNKMGIEDAPDQPAGGGAQGGGHQQQQQGGGTTGEIPVSDHSAALVDLPDSSMTWAASLAIILNSKGNSYTVDTLCDRVQAAHGQKSWSDASQIGVNQGMFWVTCNGNTAQAWGAALQNGLLWVPNPSNDTHMFVVAGMRANGEIHVLDPQHGNDVWVSMHDFTEYYGITDGYQGQLLSIA